LFKPLILKLTSSIFQDSARTAQLTLSISVIKTNQLILYQEMIAVCSVIHSKHTNPPGAVEFLMSNLVVQYTL